MIKKINPISLFLLFAILAVAILSFFWTPHPFDVPYFSDRLAEPSSEYWLGTDLNGRDIFSRSMVAIRFSLFIAISSILIGGIIGILIGITAVLYPKTERFISHMNDFLLAFPALLTALLIVAKYGPGMWSTIFAISLFNVPVFARMTRPLAKQITQKTYTIAARALGQSKWKIAYLHILPNIKGQIAIQMSSQMALAILAESGFSYLGIGVQKPNPSLGRMLEEAQDLIYTQPEQAIIPGLIIVLCVFSFNLFSDYLRDRWDPSL